MSGTARARGASRRAWRGSLARRAAETTQSSDAERQERQFARLHRASDDGEPARVRRVERSEHAPEFTVCVICGDPEMYCTWLSVRPAPPGDGCVWGFSLEQAHADQPAVVIDALDDVPV